MLARTRSIMNITKKKRAFVRRKENDAYFSRRKIVIGIAGKSIKLTSAKSRYILPLRSPAAKDMP